MIFRTVSWSVHPAGTWKLKLVRHSPMEEANDAA
jgi:hypothetical protein